jgi:hypothetical protein
MEFILIIPLSVALLSKFNYVYISFNLFVILKFYLARYLFVSHVLDQFILLFFSQLLILQLAF